MNPQIQAPHNSLTRFKRIKRSPFFELWEASPTTGKPHQIRLHARDLGLNILGDSTYGGAPFPTLCLHAQSLALPGYPIWECPPPRFFERMGLLRDPDLIPLLAGIDKRQRLYSFLDWPQESLRLVHEESPERRVDLLGSQLWISWFHQHEPTAKDLQRFEFLQSLLSRPFVVRKMQNRGADPLAKTSWLSTPEPQKNWLAEENGMKFEFSLEHGLSCGLFLDQRQSRRWTREQSQGKKVLNLFSYTCGFSLAAALGQAREVVSVDVSKEALEWGKRNFLHNQLKPEDFEFYLQDSILFLKSCLKRQRTFDLVICDPPTFGRHKGGVFKLGKDLTELLQLIHQVLAPRGRCLLSTNNEDWSEADFLAKVKKTAPWKSLAAPVRALDFESPGTETIMKQLLLEKRT